MKRVPCVSYRVRVVRVVDSRTAKKKVTLRITPPLGPQGGGMGGGGGAYSFFARRINLTIDYASLSRRRGGGGRGGVVYIGLRGRIAAKLGKEMDSF